MNAHVLKSESDEEKHERNKKFLLRNTGFSLVNYLNGGFLSLLAILLNISSITYWNLVILIGSGVIITLVFMLIILKRTKISPMFSSLVLFGQYFFFLFIYAYWVIALNEARFIALFVIVISVIFLVIAANFSQAIMVVLVLSAVHVGATLFGIFKLGQQSSLKVDLFMTGCFLLCGIIISFVTGRFADQRKGLKEAKNKTDEANMQLWGEMQLARRIQTVLLPDEPAIKGFEIATYMLPAADVGGDYYDIINVENRDWIVIGDVSGHGVSAGLIMMIVQTAIKMALAQNPTIDPSSLLSLINKTISQDIKKISEDKYMTITVLALHDNGRFFFSGLHQDIIIYRAIEKSVEAVETDGVWLGILPEISDFLNDYPVSLELNDIMLVFTDGITEAWHKDSIPGERDSATEMFGQNRMIEILENNGHKKPREIRDLILSGLDNYNIFDDITLVILKRMK